MSIYKAYDIRGIYPDEINKQTMTEVAEACLVYLKKNVTEKQPIFIGRDVRNSSPELSETVIDVIAHAGWDVEDGGIVPTDAFYYILSTNRYAGGLMITASHNPPRYNGIKFVTRGVRFVSGEELEAAAFEQIAHESETDKSQITNKGNVSQVDVLEEFAEYSVKLGQLNEIKKKFKVVLDPGNGTVTAVLPKILPKLNLEAEVINGQPDGNFPGRGPDPAKNCEELKSRVKESSADFGVAWDNDSDRIIFVDEKGEVVPGDIILALIAKAMLSDEAGPVVYDVLNSRSTVLAIQESGGEAVESRVGRFFIAAKMREIDAGLGGEASGHYYYRFDRVYRTNKSNRTNEYWYGENTWFTLFNLMHILDNPPLIPPLHKGGKEGVMMSELVDWVTKYHKSDIINFEVSDPVKIITALKEKYSDGEQSALDGLKVSYDNWWFLVRPSNTEPVIRMVVEAENKNLLERKTAELTKIITSN